MSKVQSNTGSRKTVAWPLSRLAFFWRGLFWRKNSATRRLDWLLPWSESSSIAYEENELPEGRLRWFRWPLTARILSINLLVLIIPMYGFVRVDTYRSTLIESELASMEAEGRIVARAIGATADRVPIAFSGYAGSSAVEGLGALSQETIVELGASSRSTLHLLTGDIDSRMRLFDLDGELVADTRFMGVGVNPIRVEALNLPPPSDARRGLWPVWLGGETWASYDEPSIDHAKHYDVSEATFDGLISSDVRIDQQNQLVFLVALPVQEYRKVIGSLLIMRDETGVEAAVSQLQGEILRGTFLTLGITILLSMLLANTIARPVRRLAMTANGVARSKRRQVEIPDLRFRRDEIGDLSFATRRMTETLWDRLDSTDAFAADVSHELKNPLTSLKSAVETMQAYPDSPRRGELLDIIHHDVARMDRLITDISRSSRVDAEISRMEWQELDLAQMIEHLIEARTAIADERDDTATPALTFELVRGPGLNNGTAMVRVVGDRVAQVMNNLLDNAATFSPIGGKVRVEVDHVGTKILVHVLDQGPGIPADRLTRVFERFYTDRPESDGFGNHSGLGLSIVKQIIEGHNGKIWADNADEADDSNGFGGAKFSFSLRALPIGLKKS